jgi:hypothetical protein
VADELATVRLLLLVGRSPDEQFSLLERLNCLSARGRDDRMGVILLLDRAYQTQVRAGMPPRVLAKKSQPPQPDAVMLLSAPPGGHESPAQVLARLQSRALADDHYLDDKSCRVEDLSSWWTAALPQVMAVHEDQNRIFAAITTEKPGKSEDDDAIAAFRAVLTPLPQSKSAPRTDPITCPSCGRPAPRRATYCVWCGGWLAARRGQ